MQTVLFTVGGRGDKIHCFDSGHEAGADGWHTVAGHGLPYAHVFADPSIANGSDWLTGPDSISSTASHEALEMLADPAANEYSYYGPRLTWAREVCDAVQATSYRIVAHGMKVSVSNFVLPACFDPRPRTRRAALRRHLRRRDARVAAPPEARGVGPHLLAARPAPLMRDGISIGRPLGCI